MKTDSKAQALHRKYREQVRAYEVEHSIPPVIETQVKRQHYVQRAYLEAFCIPETILKKEEGSLWVHTAEKRWQAAPSACATENYFYCHDPGDGSRSFLGETFLSDLEGASMDVLREAQAGKLPRKLQDRLTLTGYVAMALVRTPSAKSLMHHAAAYTSVQALRELFDDPDQMEAYCAGVERETGKRPTCEEVKAGMIGGQVRVAATNRAWSLRMMAEQMSFFQSLFMRMHLCVYHANGASFLTSDRPVQVANPTGARRYTDGRISHDLVFPLSRNFCLIGTFSKTGRRIEASEKVVTLMNRIQAREADRFVYSSFQGDYIQSELALHARPRYSETLLVRFDNDGPVIIQGEQRN